MEWRWNKRDEKTINSMLKAVRKGKENTDRFDFIANVKSGDLCFDLIFREYDEGEYIISTDLYVTGDEIVKGYGESDSGRAYDFFSNTGYCINVADIKGMDISKFKDYVNNLLTKEILITAEDDFKNIGAMGSKCNLIEKANKPLAEW